ncbi:MAG: SIS domain-containing protein [Alphaproteobacteria bacterium]|jgi:D-sedoheptulose 7-phosphate isomerase|nr:SIS domain-containing protein [Alphaproteobacteria bacterium]
MTIDDYLADGARLVEEARAAGLAAPVAEAIDRITNALAARKALLICGNGGSAADAMHIAGELVGRFRRERPGLKAIALGTDAAVTTAWSNDYAYDDLFARQVEALGEAGGVVWGISTSGNSENVLRALAKGREMGMTGVALTGAGGGRVGEAADILIAVPSTDTARIQELHTFIYHHICERVEESLDTGNDNIQEN